MREDFSPETEDEELKDELKFNFSTFLKSLKNYLITTVSIREDVDYEGSLEVIKKDIDFKGVNIWVLGASIVIASIGLNVNSAAVVIGAMLISPLMGPIVGLGLSVGINDFKLLVRSLKNLGTAVLFSIIISTIYFLLTPFGEVQSEILSRTKPHLLDVIIALFGGGALIVAKSQKGTVASAIFGVAIATALMPPLCTAGYGLANGNWQFFLGAGYLFLINSVFIALSTWLIVKYLRYPLATYINVKRQKRVKRYIYIIALLIIIPSGFTFWNTIQENRFQQRANKFLSASFQFEGTDIINSKLTYNPDSISTIDIFLIGEIIPRKAEKKLIKKLPNFNLENTTLKLHQSKDKTEELTGALSAKVKSGILEDIYKKNQTKLNNRDEKIEFLQDQLIKYRSDTIPFSAIKNEMAIQYPKIIKMSYAKAISTNFGNKQDTIATFFMTWNNSVTEEEIMEEKLAVERWLKVRLNDPLAKVVAY